MSECYVYQMTKPGEDPIWVKWSKVAGYENRGWTLVRDEMLNPVYKQGKESV